VVDCGRYYIKVGDLKVKKFISLILVPACLFFSQLDARAATMGGISSNGGDGIVSEFFDIARSLQKSLVQLKQKDVDVELFAKTISNAKIYSKEKVFLGSKEVTAINTPQLQEIYISQSRWMKLVNFPKLKYTLVLHEFLGLMGYDDRTFNISNDLLNGPGIEIHRVVCPFLKGSSLNDADAYTLELSEYRVSNHSEYRARVYFKGMPDGNSETLSASRMRFVESAEGLDAEIGTTGSALIQKDNVLSGGFMVHFEVWPGTPFNGTAFIQNDFPAEKVSFTCTGSFHK